MATTTVLALAGMVIMYSSGYDHGTRFVDHGRNMILAGIIMLTVAVLVFLPSLVRRYR